MVATIHFQKNFICHLREKFLITAGYQSLTFPHSLVVRIRSNVYNKSNHIAQTEPVFLRLAFMTFYPTREINQASRNPAVVCFFIHPLEAETIFTTALQQKQTWDIIKEIAILPNSRERNTQTNTSSLFCFIFRKKEAEVCGHWHLHEEICAVTVCKGGKKDYMQVRQNQAVSNVCLRTGRESDKRFEDDLKEKEGICQHLKLL